MSSPKITRILGFFCARAGPDTVSINAAVIAAMPYGERLFSVLMRRSPLVTKECGSSEWTGAPVLQGARWTPSAEGRVSKGQAEDDGTLCLDASQFVARTRQRNHRDRKEMGRYRALNRACTLLCFH